MMNKQRKGMDAEDLVDNKSGERVMNRVKILDTENEPITNLMCSPSPIKSPKFEMDTSNSNQLGIGGLRSCRKSQQDFEEGNFKYFKKLGPTINSWIKNQGISTNSKKVVAPYSKLVRCLLAAHSCTKFQNELRKCRMYGSTNGAYKIVLQGKQNVKSKLIWVDNTVKPDQILKEAKWIISPLSVKFLCWSLLITLLIIYAMTFMPYGLIFLQENPTRDLVENIMNLFFIADIIVNFFTGIIEGDER